MTIMEQNGIVFDLTGLPLGESRTLVVWGHGWGQSKEAFRTLVAPLLSRATHILIDFPGFGLSPMPSSVWGTEEYADAVAGVIDGFKNNQKVVWVGHSFGGRVGIRLAARHPSLVDGLFLIGSAGLPKQRNFFEWVRYQSRLCLYKSMKPLLPLLGLDLAKWRLRFSSPDYLAAGERREIFLKTIRENLSSEATRVHCPVAFIYGENDKEAAPNIGQRFVKLMPDATCEILKNQDHYTVLSEGSAVVIKRLIDFMEKIG